MAKYIAADQGDGSIAKMELAGWYKPEFWEGDTTIPEGFPTDTVDALIFLFTGKRTHDSGTEGTEIPDVLGWHIATLIEAWGIHIFGPSYNNHQFSDHSKAMRTRMAYQLPELSGQDLRDVADLRFFEMQTRRTEAIIRHAQQWYSDGLTLYRVYNDSQG